MRTNRGFINEENTNWEKRLQRVNDAMKLAPLIGINDNSAVTKHINDNSAVTKHINEKDKFQNYDYSLKSFRQAQNVKDTDASQNVASKTSTHTTTRMVPQLDMARKRQRCSICGLEAYLAEQMYLEKMIIHKRCFKCSYCEQPLRLDNCTLDRQLQSSFGLRWFCRQHSHLPLSDKMAKLEKYRRNIDRRNIDGECSRPGNISLGLSVAVVNAISRRNRDSSDMALNNFVDENKNSSDDSPTTLVTKAMERIRSRELDASIIYDSRDTNNNHFSYPKAENLLIERVEFGCQRGKESREHAFGRSLEMAEKECETLVNHRQQKMIDALKCMKASKANSKDEYQSTYRPSADYADNWACVGGASFSNQRRADSNSDCNGDSSSSASYDDFENVSSESTHEDDDNNKIDGELWTEFLEMLECTLTNDDTDLVNGAQESADFLNDEQMREIIEKFNRTRRTGVRCPMSQTSFGSTTDLFRTPAQQDASLYFTPRSSRPLNRRSLNDTRNQPDFSITKSPVKFRAISRDAEARGISLSKDLSNNFQNYRNSQPCPPITKKGFLDGLNRKSDDSSYNGNTSTTENETISSRRSRETRLMRSDPRRATINVDMELSKTMAVDQRKGSEAEAVYSTTELSEPTSGVLIRKQRRDRLMQKNLDGEVQDFGKISSYKHRGRSQSSANFSSLLSSFKSMLNEGPSTSKARLPVTPENVRRAQRYAQTIVARREKEHQLNAYEVQRSLDETENRLEEIRELGTALELKLQKEPQNEWLLENWVFYGEELQRLSARQADLTKRAKLIGAAEEYKSLRAELHSLQNKNIGVTSCGSEEDVAEDELEREQQLMEQMLKVLNDQKAVKAELKKYAENSLRPLTVEEVRQILADKQYTFKNFEPLFIKK